MNGLWALERNLVINPRTAVFHPTCLFTGEPVDEMTVMTLAQVEATSAGALTVSKKRQMQLAIPVSLTYRRERAAWSKKIRIYLLILGSILAALGMAVPILLGMEGEAFASTLTVAFSFAVLAFIVGCCFPYLDDMNGSKYISGIRFLEDGRIVIPKVHESILAGLPELERGFFDGFLGNESVKPKNDW